MAIKIVSPVENLVVNGTGGTLLDVQGSAGQLFSVYRDEVLYTILSVQ